MLRLKLNMFGFGQKAKLNKLAVELKGASLQEVVTRFADKNLIERPKLHYDESIALTYSKAIGDKEKYSVEEILTKINNITKENDFGEDSHLIYLAYDSNKNLRTHALSLAIMLKFTDNTEEVTSYFFGEWLREAPFYYLLPILFPAQANGRIDDFNIDREIRYALIDKLFEKLISIDKFKFIVNSYAEEHPYFRNYPL